MNKYCPACKQFWPRDERHWYRCHGEWSCYCRECKRRQVREWQRRKRESSPRPERPSTGVDNQTALTLLKRDALRTAAEVDAFDRREQKREEKAIRRDELEARLAAIRRVKHAVRGEPLDPDLIDAICGGSRR